MIELAEPRETTLRRHKLTVDDYHRMGETGILTRDQRVELIEGDVIDMSPIGSDHASVVGDVAMRVTLAGAAHAIVWSQSPVRLGPYNEPQPDVLVLRPRADRYRGAFPTGEDVLLLIEVADSSAAYDRGTKIPLYAQHGVVEVWLVDLQAQRVEVYREPGPNGYREKRIVSSDEVVVPRSLPAVEITLADLLQSPPDSATNG